MIATVLACFSKDDVERPVLFGGFSPAICVAFELLGEVVEIGVGEAQVEDFLEDFLVLGAGRFESAREGPWLR